MGKFSHKRTLFCQYCKTEIERFITKERTTIKVTCFDCKMRQMREAAKRQYAKKKAL